MDTPDCRCAAVVGRIADLLLQGAGGGLGGGRAVMLGQPLLEPIDLRLQCSQGQHFSLRPEAQHLQ